MQHKEALRQRQELAESLPDAAEILRGSLFQRKIRHKVGCVKCAQGGGHNVWVLSVAYSGGTRQITIRPEMKPRVELWLKNYHKLQAKLEQICEINHVLIRPEQ